MNNQQTALRLALEALEWITQQRTGGMIQRKATEATTAIKQALEQPVPEPVAMRMPKVGDRVVCIDDESLGTVVYLTAGGSPEIKFDDGSHGTYMLREFAELFGYTTPPAAPVQDQKSCKLCTHEQRHYMEMTGPCRACRFYSNFASATPPAQPAVPEGWQPIETAPKDFCTEFDGWNGKRVPDVSWAKPEFNQRGDYAWCVQQYENGYGWANVEVKGLTHWRPIPSAPEKGQP